VCSISTAEEPHDSLSDPPLLSRENHQANPRPVRTVVVTSPARLHYVAEGPEDGPPLVLSGSLGSTLDMWRPQRTALSDEYRVISYDHRGHGRSAVPDGPCSVRDLAEDLLTLLDRLGVASAHFCGLSLGGAVAMWLAKHAPRRVDRLVLCCTSTRFGEPATWRRRAEDVRAHGTGLVADAVIDRWFTAGFVAENPEVASRMRSMISETPSAGYARCCEALAAWDFGADLADVRAPTLVIAGAEDPAAGPEHARRIANGISGARLEILDGAAHLATYERADRVNELVRAHLGTPGDSRSNISSSM